MDARAPFKNLVTLTLTLGAPFLVGTALAADAATLRVDIVGAKSRDGEVRLTLFDSAASFLQGPYREASVAIDADGTASVVFEALPFGDYALSAVHDANGNGQLDTNFMRIPTERYAFSNGARSRFGPAADAAAGAHRGRARLRARHDRDGARRRARASPPTDVTKSSVRVPGQSGGTSGSAGNASLPGRQPAGAEPTPLGTLDLRGLRVLRTDREIHCPLIDATLAAAGADLVLLPETSGSATLIEAVRDTDLVLTCYASLSGPVIAATRRLRGIVKYGVGIDAIDIEAAKARRIPVVNVPAYAERTVAEGAFCLLLALARRLVPLDREMRRAGWVWPTPEWLGTFVAEPLDRREHALRELYARPAGRRAVRRAMTGTATGSLTGVRRSRSGSPPPKDARA